MKKKLIFLVLICLFLVPTSAKANIMCKDGTMSPSCKTCSKGCCSRHGGCSTTVKKKNTSNSASTKKATTPKESVAAVSEKKKEEPTIEEKVEEQTVEKVNSYIEDKTEIQPEKSNNETEVKEEKRRPSGFKNANPTEEDDSSIIGGLGTIAVIGAAAYGIKKRKK